MKKKLWILFIGFCLGACTAHQFPVSDSLHGQREETFFTYTQGGYNWLGSIFGNRVQFYYYDDEQGRWKGAAALDFTLPQGYERLFCFGKALGVLVNGEIKSYIYTGGAWKRDPAGDLALPRGYEGVFFFSGEPYLGIAVNHKVQFYEQAEDGVWKRYPDLADFTLPRAYKSLLFGVGWKALGVVVHNHVQFYYYHCGYAEKSALDRAIEGDLVLPQGYQRIFGFLGAVGVEVDNRVQFYEYDDGRWERALVMDLVLPQGYEGLFVFVDDVIGVVVHNRIQFYQYDEHHWYHDPGLDFSL